MSDEEGRFEVVYAPKPGRPFSVWFLYEKEGYLPGYFYSRGVEPSPEVRVEIHPLGWVRLRVVDGFGSPVPGAWVNFNTRTWPPGRDKQASAGPDGVVVAVLPAGKLVPLGVWHPVHGHASVEVNAPPGDVLDLGDVGISGPGLPYVIRVVDEEGNPVPGACLEIGGWSGTMHRADEEGRIRLPSPPSHRNVLLTAPGRERIRPGPSLDEWKADEPTFALAPSAPVAGRVLGPEGKPVVGARVATLGSSTRTDGRGRFRLEGVRAGRAVLLEASDVAPGYFNFDLAWAVAGGDEAVLSYPGSGKLRLELPEGGDTPDVVAYLLDRRGDDGKPIEVHGGPPDVDRRDNAFLFDVPAGRLRLEVQVGRGGRLVREIVVRPGKVSRLVYESPDPGRLTGRVLGPDGKPAAYAEITDVLIGSQLAFTDEEGVVQTGGLDLPHGKARLLVLCEDHAPLLTEPLDLGAGAHLDVRLARDAGVKGVLTCGAGSPAEGTRVRVRTEIGPHGEWRKIGGADTFRMEGNVTGRVRFEIREPDRLPVIREVTLVAGENRVRLELP